MKNNCIYSSSEDYILKLVPTTREKEKFLTSLAELFQKTPCEDYLGILPFSLLTQNHSHIFLKEERKKPLTEYLSHTSFSFSSLCKLAMDLCMGLSFLHHNQILHMDIKPENIFTGPENFFYLGDLDSGIFLSSLEKKKPPPFIEISPGFSAPELLERENPSIQSDIYSFGKTILSLFPQDDKWKEHLPCRHLEKLCLKCSSHHPKDRPENLKEVYLCLKEIKREFSSFSYTYSLSSLSFSNNLSETITIKRKPEKRKFFKFILSFSLCTCLGIFLFFFFPFSENIFPSSFSSPPPLDSNTKIPEDRTFSDKKKIFPVTGPPLKNTCKPLIILNLEDKHLMDITELQSLHSLTYLYLSNNKIIDITPLEPLSNLKELYLNSNLISNLKPLQSMKQLEILLLQDNSIENIEPLSGLSNLRHLDISNNPALCDIHMLTDLTHLEFLNLIGTRVTKKEIKKLKLALPHCKIVR